VLSLYQAVNLVMVMPAIAVAVNRPSVAAAVAILTTAAIVIVWLVARRNIGVHV
jgi:hypothetical protein